MAAATDEKKPVKPWHEVLGVGPPAPQTFQNILCVLKPDFALYEDGQPDGLYQVVTIPHTDY